MERGYFSPLWTLDVKSFPPPHGDLIERGEPVPSDDRSERRKHVELHGDFDNCYSANATSKPSDEKTASGKRTVDVALATQPTLRPGRDPKDRAMEVR